MKFSEVKNPTWADADKTAIVCEVTFEHIGEPVPFTANPDDSEEHGREIFARCVAGEYGSVAACVQPVEEVAEAE